MTPLLIYVDSDTLLTVDHLKDARTGQYVNTAEITASLLDASLQPVPEAQDLTLAYVVNSDGKYQGVIPSPLSLTPGATYHIDVIIKAENRRHSRIRSRAIYASDN
jgi:hypothetical protein